MKFHLIFAILFGFTLANDLFVGSWKEDLYKRKGLGPFLAERGKKNHFLVYIICYTFPLFKNKRFRLYVIVLSKSLYC